MRVPARRLSPTCCTARQQRGGGKFRCRAYVSVSPTPNITETLKAILSQLTNEPHDGAQLVSDQSLVHQIWNFLSNRRYLVIVDDIWHRNEWGIIKQSLPNNSLRSRIIMTTRSKDIAEECRTDNTDAFVYDIGFLNYWDICKLSDMAVVKIPRGYTPGISEDKPCYDILERCYGMPLALFCMSSAWAEQMQGPDGGGLKNLRATRRVEDGILSMPCMKPLADSLCRGYDNLPLHLKTLLLYCSIYRWRDTFEREILVRRWIAEGFVHEEEAAQCLFEELVRKDWIEPAGGRRSYRIHPVMLAFLRCKSQEDNFVDFLAFGSDVSSLCARSRARRILRLSLQHGHSDQVKVSESDLELSHTRSLSVFDDASSVVPFKRFQLLRVLDLEGTEDLQYAHLVEICGLPWLRYLGLKGTPITMIPSEIGELQHLETLDVRNTAITELPWEAGLIWRSVRVFVGDMELSHGMSLPEGIYQDLKNRVPENHRERERMCILLLDRFGMGAVPPHVGLFKVCRTHVHIPEFIKEHLAFLSSLDVSLCKLDDEHGDLKFLQGMRNLKALVLRLEALPREPVTIGGEGFASLESFYLDCRTPRVRFEQGAMRKLKLLTFRFYAAPALASDDLPSVGIAHLQSIEKVVFRCSPWYRPYGAGVSATIAAVRGEAQGHPNRVAVEVPRDEDAGDSAAKVVEVEEEYYYAIIFYYLSCAPGPSKS